jgi:hypothetical protein
MALFLAALVSGFLMKYNLTSLREGFMQKEVGMPLNGPSMGPYDGSSSGSLSGWSSSEPMPVGSLPQNVALEQNKLMFLANNKSSSSCCPGSGLSNDTGCLCLSESDKSLMNSRGGNK